jgi:branched-chain amino acid transport system permease protein
MAPFFHHASQRDVTIGIEGPKMTHVDILQFLSSGLSRGSIYALVGVGFALIYNASNIINFAQGEFVMLGGMLTAFFVVTSGVAPLWAAIPIAVLITTVAGIALYRFAVEPARHAGLLPLIIITLGASFLLRGLVEVSLGKREFVFPAFSGDATFRAFGASIGAQTLWILGVLPATAALLWWFFNKITFGKAIRATAQSPLAAQLVGIDTRMVLIVSFALAAALGAIAGVLTTPITLTRYDVGIVLGLKGFAAAMLGGIGNPFGALVGGLIVGVSESLTGGLISSGYQDAVAFLLILGVLLCRPQGLFGRASAERA